MNSMAGSPYEFTINQVIFIKMLEFGVPLPPSFECSSSGASFKFNNEDAFKEYAMQLVNDMADMRTDNSLDIAYHEESRINCYMNVMQALVSA